MATIMTVYNVIETALRDRTRPWIAPFVWLEDQTGVGHVKLFVSCLLAASAFVFASGRMITLIGNLLGFGYPAYVTVELMLRGDMQRETPPMAGTDHRPPVSPATRWLTYWLTFAAVLIVQQLLGDLILIIPFYTIIKISFFLWCAMPIDANGAACVHKFVVHGYLKRLIAKCED